ncbi:MAG: pyridoxamine 5'-phosphate oxidase family protein [Acidipropionibacterium sp.]|jgi:nitroimidazol reductase NimA-like FMN-containing flavoprotein (pyridoxamine 5'-phosphate oxidase superfamily)|nr:pyridoxamine 5'-phosphate oxidase family protein [Acidipropionibacterium sp.]MCI1749736.1 pyridoxamine 5'-phosphate oxidase family protein [Acidipropionibacterium sp.]
MSATDSEPPSDRTRIRRNPSRAKYDRETINAILDEGFIGHLGFVIDGQPCVIPTGYGRVGDELLIHGSSGSRVMRRAGEGIDVCFSVTHVDGIVVARSVFHQSINYRSVVVLGRAMRVAEAEKLDALAAISERLTPGSWDAARKPDKKELAATSVIRLSLAEASAKVRTGPPADDEEDYALPIWAGVIPTTFAIGSPVPDPRNIPGIPTPDFVKNYRRA